MHEIQNVKLPIGQQQPQQSGAGQAVFMAFFSNYGAMWTAKFSTGVKDAQGRDKGMRTAMAAWDAELGRFDQATLEAAVSRWTGENADKPPHLPQFLKMCQTVQKSMGRAELVALPYQAPERASVTLDKQGDGKDWARRIIAGVEAGDKRTPTVVNFARQALASRIERIGD